MYQPIPPDKAKKIKFFKSGDSNFGGLQLAVSKRKYRSFDGLLSDLTTKVPLPYGVRTIHTPGGIHGVHSLEDFEDGKSYVVSSSRKKKPMDLGRVHKPRAWHNSRLMSPQESSMKGSPTSSLSPRSSPDRVDGRKDLSPSRLPRTPKKIMVMRNGDVHTKHMMLMNRRTAQSFEDVLADISEIFRTPVKKLYSAEGMKIESLSGMFNGPELFVAAKANEKFKLQNYIDNSPFKYGRPRNKLRRKSEDFSDQPPAKVIKKSRGKWKVLVCTNDNPAASTDAVVSITVYGDKGKTDDIELGSGENKFEAGSIDEFNIQVGNIGDIYKIRISQDDSTEFAGWLCDEVHMEDVQTGELMVFPCRRWMSREEEDTAICRELPVMKDGQPLFPVVVYEVNVVTGNYWNAGTEANVYLTIIGDHGDTGHRQLYKSHNKKKFEKGKVRDNY
ncbi:oxygen-regulated protein 1-like [Anneissia japonica]|uniref:oxygen-regulated protein 1-like n=1 Tax=Anneissia japonica TaxID=1529436 RepID=UPI0014256222|nr:oxygen-regulated protein 1-like [Anneissia japonica]